MLEKLRLNPKASYKQQEMDIRHIKFMKENSRLLEEKRETNSLDSTAAQQGHSVANP